MSEETISIACVLPPRAPAWMAKASFEAQKAAGGPALSFCAGSPVPQRQRTLQYRLDARWYGRHTTDALALAPPLGTQPYAAQELCAMLAKGDWDLILNFSDCEISLDTSPRFGVWAYAFYMQNKDFVSELWADMHTGANQTTFRLLQAATAKSPLSGRQTSDQLYWKSAWFAAAALQKIKLYGTPHLWATKACKPSAPPLLPHKFSAFSNPFSFALSYIRHHKGRHSNWSLLLYEGQVDFSSLEKAHCTELAPPPDRFWADPFLLDYQGKSWMFLEELPHSTGKGFLSVCEVHDGGITTPQAIIKEDYHLSYPFVFSHQDKLYIIPESSDAKRIDLYECSDFPLKWHKKAILMEGMHFADTSLFFHNDLWWMFTCAAKDRHVQNRDELYLYYSKDVLTEDWTPHPQNPVVSNTRSARSAGHICRRDKKIFRPSQDNAQRYGHALVWNEITTLSTSEYKEVQRERLEYPPLSGIDGTHTFNISDKWTVTDILRQQVP